MEKPTTCSINGCDRAHHGRGWCKMHGERWRNHGDPLATKYTSSKEALTWLRSAVLNETDECIPWPFARGGADGRGRVKWEGRTRTSYHVALILVGREPPVPPLETRHLCGNGHLGCVNPRHLLNGTHAENGADMARHGTSPRGGRNHSTKLTEADVLAIRKSPEPYSLIAERYGIWKGTAYEIKTRRSWKWLNGES